MRRLQQKLSKVYLRQQAKGGIIDLEEEGKRMLVVTRGEEENSSGTEFTELSPTDYQLGRHLPNPLIPSKQILSKIVLASRALLDLPASPRLPRSSRRMDNGKEGGKDMQVQEQE